MCGTAKGSDDLTRTLSAKHRLEGETPDGQILYRFPKGQPDDSTQLHLTPLELIERLTA